MYRAYCGVTATKKNLNKNSNESVKRKKNADIKSIKEAHNLDKNKPLTIVILKCCPKNPSEICVTNEEFGFCLVRNRYNPYILSLSVFLRDSR